MSNDSTKTILAALTARVRELEASSDACTCAFCGARHESPTFEEIRAHVQTCPEHPMAGLLEREHQWDSRLTKARNENAALVAERDALRGELEDLRSLNNLQALDMLKGEEAGENAAITLIVRHYDMANGDNETNRSEFRDLFDDELTRLKAQGEAPSDE